MKSEPSPPTELGSTAAAQVKLVVWCKACQHQVEPDPAEMAARSRTLALAIGASGSSSPAAGGRQVDIEVSRGK